MPGGRNGGPADQNDLQEVIDSFRSQLAGASITPRNGAAPETIDEKKRKLKIANDNAEGDQALKEVTLRILFIFLGIETGLVFIMAFFQGFKIWGFGLDPWSFRLVISVTITQITTMLIIAVKHLFPASPRKPK